MELKSEKMTDYFLRIRKNLDHFRTSIESPRLYLADELSKLKNEIDIEAENKLINLNGCTFKTAARKNTDKDKINSNRKQMVDEIDRYEEKLFNKLTSNELEANFIEKLYMDIEKHEHSLKNLEKSQSNFKDIYSFSTECSRLNYSIDCSIYEFECKIKQKSSLLFLNISEIKYCIKAIKKVFLNKILDFSDLGDPPFLFYDDCENEYVRNETNSKLSTSFGILFVLNDCVLKKNFKWVIFLVLNFFL